MRFIIYAVLLNLLIHTTESMANSIEMQALEASIREARAMGLDENYIRQMETMLDAFRSGEQQNQSAQDTPQMEPNYFDVMDARSYGDCERYSDNQAYSFCASATHSFLMYTEAFAKEGNTEGVEYIYSGHKTAVINLINYVDNFMTAPLNR